MTAEAPKPPTLAEALARARQKSQELNENTDKLNEKIREFAKTLAGLRFGVKARLIIDEDGTVGWYRAIEFTKHNNQWTLMHEAGHFDVPEPDPDVREELTDAPRSVRMEAVRHFPELVHELVDAIESEAEGVQFCIHETERLMEELKAARLDSGTSSAATTKREERSHEQPPTKAGIKHQAKGSGK